MARGRLWRARASRLSCRAGFRLVKTLPATGFGFRLLENLLGNVRCEALHRDLR
jgi:hypothetical protein